jgi:hypothetical protein
MGPDGVFNGKRDIGQWEKRQSFRTGKDQVENKNEWCYQASRIALQTQVIHMDFIYKLI